MNSLSRAGSEAILSRRTQLAEELVALEFARHPELALRYGPRGRDKSLQDAGYHLAYLAEALEFDNRALFIDYVAWAKVMLHQRKVRASDLAFHLECTAQVLRESIPGEAGAHAAGFVADALRAMPAMPEELPTFLVDGTPLSLLAIQYQRALLRGERQVASRLVVDAVGRGTPVGDIYLQVFQPSQYEVGRLWQIDSISVAQEHYCTAATQLVMSQLYPHLFTGSRIGRTMVATCVASDLHELGARMVADFFEMAGWDTYYLGASTPHASVIDAVVERKADLLAISATIAYHVRGVEALITAVREDPRCARVKILVGGYPFNRAPELWRQVGADGSARDAQEAVAVAGRLLQ
jgi:MerR family transcriptional regulator, light-induced transcriptional regulator